MKRAPATVLVGLLSWSCAAEADRPIVYAAASLRDAVAEIARAFEEATGEAVVLDVAASNVLAHQILATDRGGVFLSADEEQMDLVERAGLVLEGTRRSLLSNELVVVVPSGDGEGWDPAAFGGRLALARPDVVPAGRYARAWLEELGHWARLEPAVVPAIDVRAALALVEAGAVDAGIVYATDAARSDRVRVVRRVTDGPPISYALGVLRGATEPELALAAYLGGPEAARVFERHGFRVRQEGG